MLWEEVIRWVESPMRRLLLLAYIWIFLVLLWFSWRAILLFIYQRIVLTVLVSDLDYIYQVTHYVGHGRAIGSAFFRTPDKARIKFILRGRCVFSIPWFSGKRDPRKLRARLLLLAKDGADVGERAGLFLNRLGRRASIDKFLLNAGVGLGDPALTGMAASSFYMITAALPKEENRFGAVLPMFDREGLDLEAELATGFRVYRTLIPAMRFFFHPKIIRFAWRWRFPKI